MMFVPAGVKVHLALGYTDMRKGMDGLAMLVQDTLKKDPFSGHLLAFRGKKGIDPEGPVLGRKWALSVHETHRPGWLRMASDGGL
ncbi:IS66 family insertion sequence element accessory protein TnpB [Bradyrhizobium sp. SZCCHNS3002]|uniref:IS66 family insertion sequence element accessory protein TnpB n=1 Tax=unclassified Bradyrhizobium TaxID=2631580 RepID=UPI0039655AF6